jgi:LmbE family N-acetylglucosaminyl deacetylase
MQLKKSDAQLWCERGEETLGEITHLAIVAHADDTEIMAYHGISTCYNNPQLNFASVVVTDGRGSPREGTFAEVSDQEMVELRAKEQLRAAKIGKYAAQFLLKYPSSEAKNSRDLSLVGELKEILKVTSPKTLYIHNLFDRQDTHVAVALATLEALSQIPEGERPESVFGCEVWRDLDWLDDQVKVLLPTDRDPALAKALLECFESQIAGGKRYDLATLGRWRANATFSQSHQVDNCEGATLAIEMSSWIDFGTKGFQERINERLQIFRDDLLKRLQRMS